MKEVQDLSLEARKLLIQKALGEKGLTQQDLAVLLGRSLRTVQSWISGESVPELTFEEVLEVREVLGQPIEELAKMFPGKSRRRAGIRAYHSRTRNEANKKNTQD
jgi:transcriptional regulator with XRE-family HTH domain